MIASLRGSFLFSWGPFHPEPVALLMDRQAIVAGVGLLKAKGLSADRAPHVEVFHKHHASAEHAGGT